MYKLVISDFDKTLIDDDFSIPITTVLAIDKIRRQKVKFAITTEREVNFVEYYNKDVDFIDYIIALNGAYVYDVKKENVIFEQAINKSIVKEIVNNYRNNKNDIYLYTDHSKCFLNDKNIETKEILIRDLDDFIKYNKIYKIEIHSSLSNTKKYMEEMSNKYDLSIFLNKYDKKDYLVEITSSGANKYLGSLKVCQKEKISEDEIVCFGDNYNDIPLLEHINMSCAVANAIKEVKKICKIKTFSNNNKGVEKELIKIFKL